MSKFSFNFNASEVTIILYALKTYGALHRGSVSKEAKPLREKIEEMEFTGDECNFIYAALESTFCFPPETDDEINGALVSLRFYEQWYNQDGQIEGRRQPKLMIKDTLETINRIRRKNGLSLIQYES